MWDCLRPISLPFCWGTLMKAIKNRKIYHVENQLAKSAQDLLMKQTFSTILFSTVILFFGIFLFQNQNYSAAESDLLSYKQRWEPLASLDSGRVSNLAIQDDGTVVAGTRGGLFRLKHINQFWSIKQIIPRGSAAIQPASGKIINRMTATPNGDVYRCGKEGFFRRKNGSNTWQELNLPTAIHYSFDIVSNSKGHLFIATNAGVFCSIDHGRTWLPFCNGMPGMAVLSLAIDKADYLYAGSDGHGVFRSIAPTTDL